MFKDPVALDRNAHRGLRLSPNQPYHHAAHLMATPVVAGEAALVAREYVFVFGKQPGTLPLALLSLEKGKNAYVRPSGQWHARYIPAHIRRYPFVLADRTAAPNGEGEHNFALLFDRDAPHLKGDQGLPLFTEAGEPAQALQTVQQVLTTLQRDNVRTLALVAEIEAAGLLHERALQAKPRQGQAFAIDGIRSVDTEKFATLPAETLLALHNSGALALIHAHLLSLSNLNDGPLRRDAPADQPPDLFGDETISLAGLGLVKPH